MDEPSNRSLNAPFALGTLAKIDKYLTVNRSRNSAPLCYYDHEHNFSIYKLTLFFKNIAPVLYVPFPTTIVPPPF